MRWLRKFNTNLTIKLVPRYRTDTMRFIQHGYLQKMLDSRNITIDNVYKTNDHGLIPLEINRDSILCKVRSTC